ncbi:hypothetical protein [Streptomyces sp. NBC_01618]|uniref:hypothetical protein n=1 Tax=Streptomyces sp. NBC_01618 TaxID=2975900 RepID=UPI00386B2EF1|nr:hypothetical protein OH735_00070 [Streptomyces sp. NBC_01618]WTE38364.1 hypothetical protein OH735_38360 [Streptomyces sp. NBC_01618]
MNEPDPVLAKEQQHVLLRMARVAGHSSPVSSCSTTVRAKSTPWAAGSSSIFTMYVVESTPKPQLMTSSTPSPP